MRVVSSRWPEFTDFLAVDLAVDSPEEQLGAYKVVRAFKDNDWNSSCGGVTGTGSQVGNPSIAHREWKLTTHVNVGLATVPVASIVSRGLNISARFILMILLTHKPII